MIHVVYFAYIQIWESSRCVCVCVCGWSIYIYFSFRKGKNRILSKCRIFFIFFEHCLQVTVALFPFSFSLSLINNIYDYRIGFLVVRFFFFCCKLLSLIKLSSFMRTVWYPTRNRSLYLFTVNMYECQFKLKDIFRSVNECIYYMLLPIPIHRNWSDNKWN